MTKARKEQFANDVMVDVANVPASYDYWFNKLLNYCLGMYTYKNMPKSLPAREVLMNLLLTGHCVIFQNEGELITCTTTLFGFDLYYRPTKATFGNVKINSRTLELGVDSEIVYLTRIQGNVLTKQVVDSGLKSFIARYARQMADIESTCNIYTVNMRNVSFPVAMDDATKAQIQNFYNQLVLGKREVITDNFILESFRNVDIAPARTQDKLNDLLIARDKILANFFQDIGVKYRQEQKKAQMTEDEIETDEQLLVLNVKDMLECQREGFERVNDLFGTSIEVDINPLFARDTYKERGVENDNTTD